MLANNTSTLARRVPCMLLAEERDSHRPEVAEIILPDGPVWLHPESLLQLMTWTLQNVSFWTKVGLACGEQLLALVIYFYSRCLLAGPTSTASSSYETAARWILPITCSTPAVWE